MVLGSLCFIAAALVAVNLLVWSIHARRSPRPDGPEEHALAVASGFDGRRFTVPPGGRTFKRPRNILRLLGRTFFGRENRRPPHPLPVRHPRPEELQAPGELGVTWLGHSTVLLEIEGHLLLTDPVFGERCSPVSFAGPRRFHEPPVALDDLPHLDAVLISHNHYDHLERATVEALAQRQVPFIVPLGLGHYLRRWGIPRERITELPWWGSAIVAGLTITATPSAHFSQRAMEFSNRTLWASFAITGTAHRVFFGGDSGWFDGFGEIGRRLGPFDLTMLEIGAFDEAWAPIHLGPEGAIRAHRALGGEVFLPVHYGTFCLALHDWDAPPEEATAAAKAAGVRMVTPGPGERWAPGMRDPEAWWKRR